MATGLPALVHVVDDDDAVRDSLRALLESCGVKVEVYASASDFLSGTRACGRACLIVDMHMPGISGLELIEILRAQGENLPVIAITGRADLGLRERFRDAGAAFVLDKPVDDDVLLQLIEAATAAGLLSLVAQ